MEPEPAPEPSGGYGELPPGYKVGHWTRPGHDTKLKALAAFSTPTKAPPQDPETPVLNPDFLSPKFSPASLPVAVSTKTSPDKTLALIGRAIRNAEGNLDLYNADLGDEGARSLGPALARVPKERSFTAILLGGNRLSAVGAASLALGLRHGCGRYISSLGIDNNPLMGDAGMKALAKALPATLECLYVSRINLGDSGMAELAAALPRSQIKVLDFSSNQVAEVGWAAFAETLPQLTKLRRVFANGNLLSGGAALGALLGAIRQVKGKQDVDLHTGVRSAPGGLEKLQLQDNPVMSDQQAVAALRAVAKDCALQLGTSPPVAAVGTTKIAPQVTITPVAGGTGGAVAARKAAAARAQATARAQAAASPAPLHDILER